MRVEKISILKFIDHWVGGPICIGLVLLYRLTHPFFRVHLSVPQQDLPPKKILIMKFFGIGSITLASSLVTNIRNKYPDTKIYFMTFKENREILEILALADQVVIIDSKNPFVLLKSIISGVFFCHRAKIDIVLDIEFYSKFSTIMTFLSGARWRVGFYLARFWRSSLINVPISFNSNRHMLEIYSMYAKALSIDCKDLYPKDILTTDQDRLDLSGVLKNYSLVDIKKSIALNIHASDLALCRRWPLKHFIALVELFCAENPDKQIIITGAKKEIAYSQEFLQSLPEQLRSRVIDLTGKLSLRQFLTLLSQLPVFVTNDSGPFHLAKAVGAPTISLWGPSSIDLYGPYGREKDIHDVINKRYLCSPCIHVYRTDAGYFCQGKAPCMEDIRPSEVMDLIRKRICV